MYFRNFSIALVSTLVATGAWYAYRDNSSPSTSGLSSGANQGNIFGAIQQTRGLTSQSVYSSTPQPPSGDASEGEAATSTRRAVVVDNDQVYTGSVAGDGPLQKDTDDSGRKVLEMLTPEQVTQKLRRNEESYLVGRGKGVV
jgi:pyruvate dehydrogenase phosphatase